MFCWQTLELKTTTLPEISEGGGWNETLTVLRHSRHVCGGSLTIFHLLQKHPRAYHEVDRSVSTFRPTSMLSRQISQKRNAWRGGVGIFGTACQHLDFYKLPVLWLAAGGLWPSQGGCRWVEGCMCQGLLQVFSSRMDIWLAGIFCQHSAGIFHAHFGTGMNLFVLSLWSGMFPISIGCDLQIHLATRDIWNWEGKQ